MIEALKETFRTMSPALKSLWFVLLLVVCGTISQALWIVINALSSVMLCNESIKGSDLKRMSFMGREVVILLIHSSHDICYSISGEETKTLATFTSIITQAFREGGCQGIIRCSRLNVAASD